MSLTQNRVDHLLQSGQLSELLSTHSDTLLTGAEAVALILQEVGVRTAFAYAGTSELALCDAIDRTGLVQLINGRGDKESAFMAAGGSLLESNRAVSILHGARGLTNAAGAVADARRNETGTIFIVGLPSTGSANFLPPHGEENLLPAIGTFVDWWWQAPSLPDKPAEREAAALAFASKLLEAINASSTLPARPAMFGIPQDVAEKQWVRLNVVQQAIRQRRTSSGAGTPTDLLEVSAEQLALSSRPLILVDDYALRYPDIRRHLDCFSKQLGAPVLQLRYRRGPMLFERLRIDEVANFAGWLNQFSSLHNDLLNQCDLFITVEDRNIYRRVVGDLPNCRKIAINGDGSKVLKNAYLGSEDLLLEGPADSILRDLSVRLQQHGVSRDAWFSKQHVTVANVTPEPASELSNHLRTEVVTALASVLGCWSNPVLIDDSQMFGGLVAERYDLLPQGLRVFGGHGGFVGGGLAYAAGLAITAPESNVMCLLGDQGFTNSFQGLVSAVQQQARVLFVVCNNGEAVSLKKQARASNPDWFNGGSRPYLSNVNGLSYSRLAAAIGVPSECVTIPVGPDAEVIDRAVSSFTRALSDSQQHPGPSLVELRLPSNPEVWQGIWLTQGFEQKVPERV